MKSNTYFTLIPHAAALAGLLLFGVTAFAQSSSSDQSTPPTTPPAASGHRHEEAIAACTNKAADDACSFAGRRGNTVTGKCGTRPGRHGSNSASNGTPTLSCRPDRAPADQHAPAAGSGG